MRKTFATAATLASLALVGASVQPAAAATGYDRCDAGNFCAFTGPGGTGVIAQFAVGDWDLGDGVGPQGMDDNIESIWNRQSYTWDLWKGANGSGGWTTAGPGTKGNLTGTWPNTITSLHYF